MIKAGKWTITEEEFERQFAEATKRGKEAMKTELRAREASYNRKANRLIIDLENGLTLIVPCDLMQGLRDADPKDIAAVEIGLRGASLHWEKLDQDFTIDGLARGIFGTKKWMAELERDRLKQKPKAVRTNGKTGSRQRKSVATASPTSSGASRSRKVA